MSPKSVGLLEVSDITTGSSNTVDSNDDGMYPFFDRSQIIKHSDKYLFDAEAVIVPGEGMDFVPRYVNGKFDLHQRAYAVFPKKGLIDGKYLYYAIMNNKSHFSQVATGSTVKSLRQKSFELMNIPMFGLDYQRKISKVLSDIDAKIEINTAINDNLHAMAKAIFDNSVSAGNVEIHQLSDVCESVTDGVHNTVEDDPKGGALLLSCKNIKNGQLIIGNSERTINTSTFDRLRKRTKLAKGDILLTSVGTIGETLLLMDPPDNIEFQRSVALIKPNTTSNSFPIMWTIESTTF